MNFKTSFILTTAVAVLLCAVSSVQAQPANGASPYSSSDAATPEHAKGLPSDEAVLRQHLASDDSAPAGNANVTGKARPASGAGAPGSVQGAGAGAASAESGVAAAVKDFVKPLHQEVSNSSVVQAVRQLDAAVSGKAQADAENGPANTAMRNAATAGSAGSQKADPNAAALMWAQFVDEVLPWAVGGAILGLLGYGGHLWLKMLKLKNLRLGEKRRAVRKTRRSASREASSATASMNESESDKASFGAVQSATMQTTVDGGASKAESRRSSSRSSGSTTRRKSRRSVI
jgi:hypothetical protein